MWQISQCSVEGRSHINQQIPCQDKTFSLIKNNISVIALADGAGSAKQSHFGAKVITKFICNDFVENFDRYFDSDDGIYIKEELVRKINLELNTLSQKLNCKFEDLASTLMAVSIKNDEFIIIHIGDGLIGYLKDNKLKVASNPENGEFINTTIFTTSKDLLLKMKLIKGNINNIDAFFIMSDGTETSFYNKKENKFAEVLKKIINLSVILQPEKMEELLINSFKKTVSKFTNDDCSISLIVNKKGFKGYNNCSKYEKMNILNIDYTSKYKSKNFRELIIYNKILNLLEYEMDLIEISRVMGFKSKYLNRLKYIKRYIDRLLELNLIQLKNNKYKTILTLDEYY